MIATEQGKSLYNRLASTLDNLEKVSSNLSDNTTIEKTLIRLGTPLDYFHEVGLKKLIDSQFHLQVKIESTSQLIDELAKGKLDAVVATQQVSRDNIDYKKIDEEEFCLVSSPGIVLPEKIEGKHDKIKRFLLLQKWISYSAELPIIRRFWHINFNQRPNIEATMIVPSLLTIQKAVELGWGISVLPRYLCQQSLNEGSIKILWQPPQEVSNNLWIATRKVDRNNPAIERLISLMGKG